MAKFNIKQYGDNLIDHTFMELEKVVYNLERQIFLAMGDVASSVERARKLNKFPRKNKDGEIEQGPAWENRTWNLVSSFYMMLLYDGKLVGVETMGAIKDSEEWIRKSGKWNYNKKTPSGKRLYQKGGYNPVFSYTYTKRGMTEWRGDNKEHYPFYGGFAYANYAMERVKRRNRKKGYVVIFGFGMPYSTYSTGRMKDRTEMVLMWLFENMFRNKMAKIGIPTYYKKASGEYKTSAVI